MFNELIIVFELFVQNFENRRQYADRSVVFG